MPIAYDDHYFTTYLGRDATPTGARLTAARIDFVRQHWSGSLLDVGIGGGRFVEESGAMGFDINPSAVQWLLARKLFHDPELHGFVMAATFWDSLEHMERPDLFLRQVKGWAFVSIPVFDNAEHALRSKHFKPGEHYWYFTAPGFRKFMDMQGFECVAESRIEEACGREDIGTFALRRRL